MDLFKVLGIVLVTVALSGCGGQQKDDNKQEVVTPSDNAITYDCDGEIVKADFNNDVEPPTATIYIVDKNVSMTLPSGQTGSGARYTDGTVTFWTHQGEATLSTTQSGDTLTCKEVSNE